MEEKHHSAVGIQVDEHGMHLPSRTSVSRRGRIVLIVIGVLLAAGAARTIVVNVLNRNQLDAVAEHMRLHNLGRDDLLFATSAGTPISRNTFRTRVWQPAVRASGVSFNVRMHDLRHAHASWLLAGGADLKTVMDRLGHAQIHAEQGLLALKVNGKDLSLDHGFPARIIVPALPGVHCTKWVGRLEFA